jgi:hypothetical protein
MAMKNQKGKGKKKSRVLSDHQQVGKRFVPPMQQIGPWKDANWVGVILPELLWIGLLNNCHGWVRGAELSLFLARAATQATGIDPKEFRKQFGQGPKQMFATTTAYRSLTDEQRRRVIENIKEAHQWEPMITALAPLNTYYPNCPLNFLFEEQADLKGGENLEHFKAVLSELFDRYEEPATFMMANAMYIAFCTNKMRVVVSDDRSSKEDSALANLPAIKDFPKTEESRLVAANIRASIGVLVIGDSESREWPDYFWNRGLELEACDHKRIYETYE